MSGNILFFGIFLGTIIGVLMLDLLVIGRKSHQVSLREAASWTGIWILFALGFAVFLRLYGEYIHGIGSAEELKEVLDKYYPFISPDQASFMENLSLFRKSIAVNFISGYLIEESLSIDNLFVIMAILQAFSVKKEAYKKVLFWGIFGAIVMRFIFIFFCLISY